MYLKKSFAAEQDRGALSVKTQIYISGSFDPRFNLALEDLLFDNVSSAGEPTVILYIWQNANTVVIGKSQNAWRECRVSELEADGGIVVRRTSGGGAVYHDLGNLCYTFIASQDKYDLERQLKVILTAVKAAGIDAGFSGRNDIVTADGRKFSGNAFRFTKKAGLMHGTLLIDTDSVKMSRYLNVSPAKIQSKGVSSVRSRVVNLIEISPELTIDSMKERLMHAFSEEYGVPEKPPLEVLPVVSEVELDGSKFTLTSLSKDLPGGNTFYERYQRFSSWEWRLGETMPFDVNIEKKYTWGVVNAGFTVNNGIISDARIETDAMDAELGEVLTAAVKGTRLDHSDLKTALLTSMAIIKNSGFMIGNPEEIAEDIAALISGI